MDHVRKPACLESECIFFDRDEGCILMDEGEIEMNCPCVNGEFEALYGENGELWNG